MKDEFRYLTLRGAEGRKIFNLLSPNPSSYLPDGLEADGETIYWNITNNTIEETERLKEAVRERIGKVYMRNVVVNSRAKWIEEELNFNIIEKLKK